MYIMLFNHSTILFLKQFGNLKKKKIRKKTQRSEEQQQAKQQKKADLKTEVSLGWPSSSACRVTLILFYIFISTSGESQNRSYQTAFKNSKSLSQP